MNHDSSSSVASPLQDPGLEAEAGRRQVRNVAELRELIRQTQEGRAQEAPRTYLWIPFTQEECAKVGVQNPPRTTLNESAQYHAQGTGIRQMGMDLRREAEEPLSRPYSEEELCAAFNQSPNQANLLERAAMKTPMVIQSGVDCVRPPQAGDTVLLLAHGHRDHAVIFGNHNEVRMGPDELVQRMQSDKFSNEIAKLKLLTCGSHGQILQGLADACQAKNVFMETKLSGYGFSKPGAQALTQDVVAQEPTLDHSLNFSYVHSAQPDVRKLTSHMHLGHLVTGIKDDFQKIMNIQPNMEELKVIVDQRQKELDQLGERIKSYDPVREAAVLANLKQEFVLAEQEMDTFDKVTALTLSDEEYEAGYAELNEKVRQRSEKVSDQKAWMKQAMSQDMDYAMGALDMAESQLEQAKKLYLSMGLDDNGQVIKTGEQTVFKSTGQKVSAKVRDMLRPVPEKAAEVPKQEVGAGEEEVPAKSLEGMGQDAEASSVALPSSPKPSHQPSLRDEFKRGGAGGNGGNKLTFG